MQNLYQFNLGKWQKARGLARMQSRMQLFAFWNLKNRFYRSQTRRNFRVLSECNPECKKLHSGIVFEEFTAGEPQKIRGFSRMQQLHSGIWRCRFGRYGAVTIGKLRMTGKIEVFRGVCLVLC